MNSRSLYSSSIIITSFLFMLVSCSSKNNESDLATFSPASQQKIPVNSILVLPTKSTKEQKELNYSKTKQIEAGIDILTNVLKEELSWSENVAFLAEGRKESLMGDFNGSELKRAQHVATQLGQQAVLITTLNRFVERDGKTSSVNQPASVAFTYQLIHVETGKMLCMGVFDETQQTLFSNIFSFSKAKKRGFKWISAEELIREGVDEKFAECSYLCE